MNIILVLLRQSLPTSILVVVVLLLRLFLRKSPKWIICVLWALVALRLICPLTIESPFSVVPSNFGSGEIVNKWLDGFTGEYTIINEGNDTSIGNIKAPEQSINGNTNATTDIFVGSSESKNTRNQILPYLFYGWLI